MEYIIQLEPETIEAMKLGEPIQSDVPSDIGPVRAYRVIIGDGILPRELPSPEPSEDADSPSRAEPTAAPPDNTAPPAEAATPRTFQPPGQPTPPPAEASDPEPPSASSGDSPPALPPNPDADSSRQQQTAFLTPRGAAPATNEGTPESGKDTDNQSESSPRPWWLLTVTALALAGSLTGNVYLFWILREAHARYRKLAAIFTPGRSSVEQ
jgi:hypothetical protein